MCEQCTCEAKMIGQFLPGWYFVQATKDGSEGEMKAGGFGLVQCNNPDFRFTTLPTPSQVYEMTEEQANALGDHDPLWDVSLEWQKEVEKFENDLWGEPYVCWELVQAAISCGYDRSKNGRFAMWLFHRLGRLLQTRWASPLEPDSPGPLGQNDLTVSIQE